MNREIRIVVFIMWMTLVAVASLVVRNTNVVLEGNNIGERQEYQRVLLGCNTAGARESTDPMLRELCDVRLLELAEEIE
jgi:hypothetical protein